MAQFPMQALFSVTNHLGNKAEAASEKLISKDVFEELEDSFGLAPSPRRQYELEEPCAEPDVEPSPVEEQAPTVNKRKSGKGRSLAAAVSLFALLALCALQADVSNVVTSPTSAPLVDVFAEVVELIELEELIPKSSEAEAEISPVQALQEEADPVAVVLQEESEPTMDESLDEDDEAEAQAGNDAGTYTVPLTRHSFPVSTVGDITYYRSAYFGTVHVGSPAVPFKVVFDTGSGHLILPSTYCQSETCRAHRRYRRSDSGSAKDIDYDGTQVMPGQPRDQITVSFGTGEVTGVFVEDVVCMHDEEPASGNSSAVALASGGASASDRGCIKLRLIAATAMSEEPFKSFQFDGVLGLGLDGLSQAPEFNYLDVLAASFGKKRGAGKTPHTFAVFLAEDAEEESKITFGGWDDNHLVEDLSWNDVLDPEQGHWTIRIKSLRIGDEVLQLCHEGCKGVVDTGTSLLAVPAMAFSELYTLLRHPAHMEGHCMGPGPTLHIDLDHFTISLGPEDYARLEKTPPRKSKPRFNSKPHNVTADGRTDLHCKPMLMSMDLPAPLGPKLFILGEPVLRKYYSVYDAASKRVGLARARHHTAASSPLAEDMSPALKMEPLLAEKSAAEKPKSMFEVFRWKKLHRYN